MLKRNRKSIRLKGYDYSQPGHYFITICTHERQHLFGTIRDGSIQLNDMGEIADQCWRAIPEHYPGVQLDAYVIMPDHVHGVLVVTDRNVGAETDNVGAQMGDVGAQNFVPLREPIVPGPGKNHRFGKTIPRSIATIVRGFKTGVTKWARKNTDHHIVWQRNYYEHIVRDGDAMNRIRRYIRDNPSEWTGGDDWNCDEE